MGLPNILSSCSLPLLLFLSHLTLSKSLSLLPSPVLGEPEIVVFWFSQHCNCSQPQFSPNCTDLHDPDYPDTPPRAFLDAEGNAHLWATDAESRVSIQSSSVGRVRNTSSSFLHNCSVHIPSQFNCSTDSYNFQTWLHSPYMMDDGTTAFAFVHMEYHGWQCPVESQCNSTVGGSCAMEAIQLWTSGNGGWDWSPASSSSFSSSSSSSSSSTSPTTEIADILVAVSPYTFEHSRDTWNHSEIGFGDPGTIVRGRGPAKNNNATDPNAYYVLIASENPAIGNNEYHGLQQRGQCIMKSTTPLDPRSWRGWDGQGYNVQFLDPYSHPTNVSANTSAFICSVVNTSMIIVSVGWSTQFSTWIAAGFGYYKFANGTEIPCCGAWLYAISDDLINWSTPQLVRPCKQEGVFQDWEYDPSLLQPRTLVRTPQKQSKRNTHTLGGHDDGGDDGCDESAATTATIYNWHEQLDQEGVYLYYWQADPVNGGRNIMRQSISFPQVQEM